MTQDRYDLLDAHPGWEWDLLAEAWNRQWEATKAVYETHNTWPSEKADSRELRKLGSWVSSQRDQGNKLAAGQKSVMTQEHYDLLDAHPGWEWQAR